MKQRWLSLWNRVGAQGDAEKTYNDLVARYSESHRAYHTLAHIKHCLKEFEQVRYLAISPDPIEFAIWYHDAIYDTRAKDNEERSAALAAGIARNVSLPNNFSQTVARLIMATMHSTAPTDFDAQILMDIDLSILGQAENKFDEYDRQIRKEYEWVPEHVFVARRLAILQSFLDRQNIYATQFFRDKYEAQARRNIARAIARLKR